MSKLLTGALTLAVFAFAPASGWATIVQVGGGFTITDDNITRSSTIAVADDLLVDSLFITLDIAHTWVGDLIVSLSGPGGTADIMVRTGGGSNVNAGDGSDLGSWLYFPPGALNPIGLITTLPYTFADGGPGWWATAGAFGEQETVPDGTYAASGPNNAPVSLNAIFNSTSTKGDWTLAITDAAGGDDGVLDAWTLQIETNALPGPGPGPGPGVPAPATLALFGLGLAGLGFSRRRKA